MKDIKATTADERALLNALQAATGAQINDWLGAQTLTDIARQLDLDLWPRSYIMYGQPVIIGNDLLAASPKTGLSGFSNSISGGFTYPRAETPCSVLINAGKALQGGACHAWAGYPETVIYRLADGGFGVKRCLYAADLPAGVRWAVGGMGLLDMYDPAAEGFCRFQWAGKWYDYSDVLRRTDHTLLGVKGRHVYLCYVANMTGAQVNAIARDKHRFDAAIMLDGGGLAAINCGVAKRNIYTKQGYILQAI